MCKKIVGNSDIESSLTRESISARKSSGTNIIDEGGGSVGESFVTLTEAAPVSLTGLGESISKVRVSSDRSLRLQKDLVGH